MNDDQLKTGLLALNELADVATAEVRAEGIADDQIHCRRSLDLRYAGRDAYFTVDEPADRDYRDAFVQKHRALFGYDDPAAEIEIVSARVAAIGKLAAAPGRAYLPEPRQPTPMGTTDVFFAATPIACPTFDREALVPGDTFAGPALVIQQHSTTVVEPGWSAVVLSDGQLLLSVVEQPGIGMDSADGRVDPVSLEVFFKAFGAIAEQMGITLRRTASSVNVKERLDYSCASSRRPAIWS